MKSLTVAFLALSFSLTTAAQMMWGGGDDWESAPACAKSCFSSAYPMSLSNWENHCATPTSLSNCASTACSSDHSAYTAVSSMQSSMCSAFHSCSSMHHSCSGWPFGDQMGMGWGGMGGNGWYTVTGSDGHTSGFTTRTVFVTTTVSGLGATSVAIVTTTQTATLIAAAAVAGTTTAAATTSKTANAAVGLGTRKNRIGALIAIVLSAIIA
ncbi:hypothetical protein BGZ60DRAFT_199417 [Tricladium varicosporioides]|nr:hypothetical protein BGZ60DRAFT_199417 [Hymenoscyphus varicosporioides]